MCVFCCKRGPIQSPVLKFIQSSSLQHFTLYINSSKSCIGVDQNNWDMRSLSLPSTRARHMLRKPPEHQQPYTTQSLGHARHSGCMYSCKEACYIIQYRRSNATVTNRTQPGRKTKGEAFRRAGQRRSCFKEETPATNHTERGQIVRAECNINPMTCSQRWGGFGV